MTVERKFRELVSEKIGRGLTSIGITPEGLKALKEIKVNLSRSKFRELMQTRGLYKVEPMKKRKYKIVIGVKSKLKKEDRVKGTRLRSTHLVDLLKNKTLTEKQVWTRHVRCARAVLKKYKGKVKAEEYRKIYLRVKGGYYKSRREGIKELENTLEGIKLI